VSNQLRQICIVELSNDLLPTFGLDNLEARELIVSGV